MKIFLDTDGLLHIDQKVLSTKVPVIFEEITTKKFDILDYHQITLLPEAVDMDVNSVVNENGVVYASTTAVYTAIKAFWKA